ncbi:MAG: electron transfer flavoprotein subunit beta, partial [candidate division WOR-3 bacterium]
ASLMGIKRAQSKELKVLDASALGIDPGKVGVTGSQTALERVYVPVAESQAEILQGEIPDVSARLAEILKSKGVL